MSSPGRSTYEFRSYADFSAHAAEQLWTDGLPVVPPTPELVEAMVAGSGRPADQAVAALPPKYGEATVEAIAVNAVMAGCRPEYMPIIVTAVEAMLDPAFDLYGTQVTTHPCAHMVLVSGPIADAVGVNGATGCFGPGFPANATIGRAVRLILQNIGGAFPGVTDMATHGSPAKYGFCFTENMAESPWEPFHVHRGLPAESSAVTITAAESPHNINDHVSATPEGLMFTIAQTIATMGKNNAYARDGDYFVVLGVEHANILARAGWERRDVQRYLYERARIPYRAWRRGGMAGMVAKDATLQAADDDMQITMTMTPDDVHILVAGGRGRHSMWIPTFANNARSVTRQIT